MYILKLGHSLRFVNYYILETRIAAITLNYFYSLLRER